MAVLPRPGPVDERTLASAEPFDTEHPALSRRRELGATSARSLLLTVLGEFVLPRPEPVWTQTLIDVLAELGVEQKSARQALARTAAEGLLASDRSGRRVRWSLSTSGRGCSPTAPRASTVSAPAPRRGTGGGSCCW